MYYFIGEERNLLIDTGTGIKSIRHILEEIDNKPIDVILTHGHWDHLGNIHEFEDVYVHKNDLKWVKDGLPIPEAHILKMMLKDVPEAYLEGFNFQGLTHDNPKDISEFEFKGLTFIHTPGHSPGSISIYDKQRKILFSGDVIYKGTIYCHYESTDPKDLYDSVKTLKQLDIERIMSGHYNDPKIEVIEDLCAIMTEFETEKKLCHGSGLKCKNEICLQL